MILEGKILAEKIYDKLTPAIRSLGQKGTLPHLAVVLVGKREDSEVFVKLKEKKAREIGMEFSLYRFDEDETEGEILTLIDFLNNDPEIHGIIVQLPLPDRLDTEKVLNKVSIEKDVDGLREGSLFAPPAPMAILHLLEEYKIDLSNKRTVILGRGRLVGTPLERIMKERRFEVKALDMDSANLVTKIRAANILISATGTEDIITEDLVNKDMVVVDAAKDVCFERVKDKVEALTPPIGGVGPITVALLLANTVEAVKRLAKN